MKTELIQSLTETCVDYWPARGFQYAQICRRLDKLAFCAHYHYSSKHIRPLAVSPLNHPESVPIPWGFPISGPRKTIASGRRRV